MTIFRPWGPGINLQQIYNFSANVTLFAPNDEAMKGEDLTHDVLLYHAVEGLINFSDITEEEFVNHSVAGPLIRFNAYSGVSFTFFL